LISKNTSAVGEEASTYSEKDYTIYVTETGECYHTAGYSSLRKSRTAIKKSGAIAAGYSPCSRCNPDSNSTNSHTPSIPSSNPIETIPKWLPDFSLLNVTTSRDDMFWTIHFELQTSEDATVRIVFGGSTKYSYEVESLKGQLINLTYPIEENVWSFCKYKVSLTPGDCDKEGMIALWENAGSKP
jgi:hypothetical protein